jgi:phosphoserine aminotransferase
MTRKFNFHAGPSTLPLEVLEQLRDEMVDFHGTGLSLIEDSHRGKTYEKVHNEAIELFKELFGIPSGYQVLFLGGGGTLQFAMIPMNFLPAGRFCDFALTGSWSKKAYDDAKKLGQVKVVFDGKPEGYVRLPEPGTLKVDPEAAYLYLTANETIGGLEWKSWPETGEVPLFCDMSSDILSRPVPVEKFSLIFAGAQKNLGPAGVTLVILRDELVARCPENLPAYLSYRTHAENNSLYNTPPVFAIWALKLVLEHMKRNGGLEATAERNERKAKIVYDAIEASSGFYRCPVDPACRSNMNLVFRLGSEDLEKKFIAEADAAGMIGLKGHRSVGGCRASLYNAMPVEGAEALAAFMKEFARKNG